MPLRACPPEPVEKLRSLRRKKGDVNTDTEVYFKNEAGVPIHIFWCGFDGQEREEARLDPGEDRKMKSFVGHVFNFRTVATGRLINSLEVEPPQLVSAFIKPCLGLHADEELGLNTSRWAEFDALVGEPDAPCVGPSSKWSCVRYITPEQVAARTPAEFGFLEEEAKDTPYEARATSDHLHNWQMKHMPNHTEYHKGYLKMQIPKDLFRLLSLWEQKYGPIHQKAHEIVPGFFTNIHKVSMDMLEVSHFPNLQHKIMTEMKDVMQWWTRSHLKHTVTFGMRIYKKGSMLINHVDRKESHLVSAILQVNQETEGDEGWPVEVVHPHVPGVKEVYLQPGEMLLYEGARIAHGRPMRFKGKSFSNIFSHFAPADWRGVSDEWQNPHFHNKQEL